MANGNWQQLAIGQGKNDTDWDVSLKSFRTWDEAGGTHRVIGNSGNRVIEKQMAISAKERGQKRSEFQSRKGLKYLRNAVCFQ